MTTERTYTLREAARKLRLTTSRLRQLIRAGRIAANLVKTAAVACGYYYEITESELRRFMSGRQGPGRPRLT